MIKIIEWRELANGIEALVLEFSPQEWG